MLDLFSLTNQGVFNLVSFSNFFFKSFELEKLRNINLVHCFEDEIKLKIPFDIKQILITCSIIKFYINRSTKLTNIEYVSTFYIYYIF